MTKKHSSSSNSNSNSCLKKLKTSEKQDSQEQLQKSDHHAKTNELPYKE